MWNYRFIEESLREVIDFVDGTRFACEKICKGHKKHSIDSDDPFGSSLDWLSSSRWSFLMSLSCWNMTRVSVLMMSSWIWNWDLAVSTCFAQDILDWPQRVSFSGETLRRCWLDFKYETATWNYFESCDLKTSEGFPGSAGFFLFPKSKALSFWKISLYMTLWTLPIDQSNQVGHGWEMVRLWQELWQFRSESTEEHRCQG